MNPTPIPCSDYGRPEEEMSRREQKRPVRKGTRLGIGKDRRKTRKRK
jgi:hypothetical protein